MNITFEGVEVKTSGIYTDNGGKAAAYGTHSAEKPQGSGFSLDISGSVMDNSAYAEHGKSIDEVIAAAEQEDVKAKRDYMAIMSNSVSDEDFARLQKEGFHPGSTDIETVVTIIDKIKVALAKGGTEVAGYTDTVSDDVLREIAGSEAFAQELKKQFEEKNVPLTEENIAAVRDAWDILTRVDTLSEGSVKYMVENHLEPTPENLYTARYSAVHDGNRQGKGYYAAGGVAGYYAKKPDEIDFEKLRPQMEKVIEEAGYPANEENFDKAKWLVEKGIPLNEENFSLLDSIGEHKFPVTVEDFMTAAACALADGTEPAKADLGKKETDLQKAAEIMEKTASIEDKAADIVMARDLPLTLRNLLAAQDGMAARPGRGGEGALTENIHGRRLLEEVRLTMTVEVNLKLLRSGFQIETASLEKLVDKLKAAEMRVFKELTGQVDGSAAREKASLFEETLGTLRGIRFAPAAIMTNVSVSYTLTQVHTYGAARAKEYEKAGQSYETMMTEPRKDMGDSIQKAFRNVDDILESMNLETSEMNRRAVRILGYNSLEITQENIGQVREKDELLGRILREMKPGRVLNMIRDGINPLSMSLEELGNYFNQQKGGDDSKEMESYSRFLYKLEKQKGISQEEKSAYIGIYRLVRQIEKADDAAVGALWQAGAEFTLENLLKAHRSMKRGKMDYTVDDDFGGVNAKKTGRESITSQIERGFAAGAGPERGELEELLEDAGDEGAGKEFDRMAYNEVRTAMKSEEEVLRYLTDYNQPVTAENLLAAERLLRSPKEIWREFEKLTEPEEENASGAGELLEEAGEKILDALGGGPEGNAGGREITQKAYESFQETIQNILKNMAYSESARALDVKAMSMLYKQVTFMGGMAKEENYEIPARIGDGLTSINLKIIHSGQKESRVAISFEAETFGKVAANFELTESGLSGLCICSKEAGTGLLKDNQEFLQGQLKKDGITAGDIYFTTGEKLNLTEFSLKASAERRTGDDSGLLYKAAKAFIGFVQETGIEKGRSV